VDHRNPGRGDLARHERQEGAGWGDPVDEPAAAPYLRPRGSYRTPSRRRARDRGAPEPTDTYIPSWALPTGESAPGTGRHRRADSTTGYEPTTAYDDSTTAYDDVAGLARPTAYGRQPWDALGTRRRRIRTADGWRDSDELTDDRYAGGDAAPTLTGHHPDEAGDRWRRADRAGDDGTDGERPAATPGRSTPGNGTTTLAARWIRSPDEIDPAERQRRLRDGWGGTAAHRRGRDPDAEPVRRRRDSSRIGRRDDPDPVRRAGAGRWRADPLAADDDGDGYADTGPASRYGTHRDWSDEVPWDRFGDTHTGMLARVTDDDDAPSVGRHARDRAPGTRGVDPAWGRDAGGRHADATAGGRGDDGRHGRDTGADRWDALTDTGTWDRLTDTTEWRREELLDVRRDREDADPAGDGDAGGLFRLAEDDPRWTGIPDSAPKSPPVDHPGAGGTTTFRRTVTGSDRRAGEPVRLPRQRSGRADRVDDRATAPTRRARRVESGRSTGPTRRPAVEAARRRRAAPLSRRLEDDLLDPRPSGPLAAALYAAAWYAVPVLVLLVWVLTLDAGVPVSCVPELAGSCESEQERAIAALLDGLPRFGAALATSLVLAVLLRWVNRSWRVVSIGLAAAVIGGGLTTLLFSVITGEPLG
jgi:hypothetical protein